MDDKKIREQWHEQIPPTRPAPPDFANDGVLDPAEAGYPLPDGLERSRKSPLNKVTGRNSTK